MLHVEDKKLLLKMAREAIAARWPDTGQSEAQPEESPHSEQSYQGVFVSLHIREKLRGCVGSLKAVANLAETIGHAAQAAAFQDPRFPPLQAEELPETQIEISLLYPMQTLHTPEALEIGKDGLMIRCGEKHGLLLPQVASRRNWDARTFLQHLCRKADLPPDAWQSPQAELYHFRAEIFSDIAPEP
ncbi:MAG: AmmeMemoRadiSam system protein A [bacterium]